MGFINFDDSINRALSNSVRHVKERRVSHRTLLLSAHQLRKSYGARALFESLTFSIHEGDRIGLIGPNGAGKSTLLRLLAQDVSPDQGTIAPRRGLKMGFLSQVPEFAPGATVREAVREEASDAQTLQQVEETLSRLGFHGAYAERLVSELSGGQKKRVALARELAKRPDLLLLDEPTNHLDVESILWLEDFLRRAPFASVTVTHDRAFLQNVSRVIWDLDRKHPEGLLRVEGDYATFLELKSERLISQTAQEERLRNTVRRETEWLRQGAKARTTKQTARINRALELQDTLATTQDRNRDRSVRLDMGTQTRSPKNLIEATQISKSYDDTLIVPPLDLKITAGSRWGILGVNGCGKSTLIRMLLGDESPDSGSIRRADGLEVRAFEQNRESLDPHQTLYRAVCPTGDHVLFRGTAVHVRGYLDRFLFTPDQLEMKVGKFSGGEQSRILLAKLMLTLGDAHVLILDEPTNDLDLATLEVLQEQLEDFAGAVVLVTHDRYFLDQVTDQILAFERDVESKPILRVYSGVAQWQANQRQASRETSRKSQPASESGGVSKSGKSGGRKLGYKEQREFDGMEQAIEAQEALLARLTAELEAPENATNAPKLSEIGLKIAQAQSEIERLYQRWSELV